MDSLPLDDDFGLPSKLENSSSTSTFYYDCQVTSSPFTFGFAIDHVASVEVCKLETLNRGIIIANNDNISTMNLELEGGAYQVREENEGSLITDESVVDMLFQASGVSQNCVEPESYFPSSMICFDHKTEVLDDEQSLVAPIWPSKNMIYETMVFTCEDVGNCNMTLQVVADNYISYKIISVGEWHIGCQFIYMFFTDMLISRVKKKSKEGWGNEYSESIAKKLFQVLSTCVIHLKEEIIEFTISNDSFSFLLVNCCFNLLPNKVHYHLCLFDKDVMGIGVFSMGDELFLQNLEMYGTDSSNYVIDNSDELVTFGVRQGYEVVICLSMLTDLPRAKLACARIDAIYSVSEDLFSHTHYALLNALKWLPEVDIISALAAAATTVMKRPEAIHVSGSVKVSAIQVLEKYLNRQGFLIVDCGCATCTCTPVNLDELVVSTKSENDNVATVVLSGKLNFDEHVHFLRRANYPASLPLIFVGALTNSVDVDFEKEPIGLEDSKNVYCIWPSTKGIAEIVQSCVLPCMFKSDYEAIKGRNNIWTMLLVPTAKPCSWDPSSCCMNLGSINSRMLRNVAIRTKRVQK